MSRRRKKGGKSKRRKDVVQTALSKPVKGQQPVKTRPKSSVAGSNVKFEDQERVTLFREFFTGPLPPPELLGQYAAILEGGAERIFRMTEEEAKHRRAQELDGLHGNLKSESRGQWFAFIILMTAIVGGVVLIALDKQASGLTTLISSLGGVASLFVWVKRQKVREMKDKSVPVLAGADPPHPPPALPNGPG